MRRIVILLLLILAWPALASAGDNESRWGFGLQTGFMKLVGGDWDYSNVDQFGALVVDYGVARHWTLEAALKYGYVRPGVEQPGDKAGWTTESGAPLYTEMWQPAIRARYHLAPDATFNPFFGFGAGVTVYRVLNLGEDDPGIILDGTTVVGYDTDGNQVSLKGTLFNLTLDAGVDIFFSDTVAANAGIRYHVLAGVDRDNIGMSSLWGPEHVDANTGMWEGFLGITLWFGNRDNDGDGILNKYDACPDRREDPDGFEDFDGCPDLDNDGDGLLDENDGCPNDPEDVDGFEDEDGCPDPDNDRDGLLDLNDACPDEPEDFDGFQDDDGCPDPDNDGDCVPDDRDQCPNTRAGVEVGPDGCHAVSAFLADVVLEGVSFVSGSAQLTPESVSVLAMVADSLKDNPTVRVEIRGHTDSTGNAELNRDLSHQRASAVRDVLIQLGVEPQRLVAVGYGEDYPIADNGTPSGRGRNRRVEIHRID